MRREELYLADIVDAADAITRFIADADAQTFAENDLLRSAVLNKLAIIGEAAARLSREFHNRHPEIEWTDIIGFRNIVVHAYFAVDWNIVWVAATEDVPYLRQKIAEIIENEYSG